jgi:hypothetical protein
MFLEKELISFLVLQVVLCGSGGWDIGVKSGGLQLECPK